MGSDVAIKWKAGSRVTVTSKFSYIYAKDTRNDDVLIFIPPAQFENGISVRLPSSDTFQDVYAGVSVPVTFRQNRAPMTARPVDIGESVPEKSFDFAEAPEGYALLNARIGFKVPVGEHSLGVTVSGENILNKSYRNYMNRLRYYSEDIGSNFILRLSYNFLSH
jgi:iron complex outermembrane receptor protein